MNKKSKRNEYFQKYMENGLFTKEASEEKPDDKLMESGEFKENFAENYKEITENEEEMHKEELKADGFYENAVDEAFNKAIEETKAEIRPITTEVEDILEGKCASEAVDGLYKEAARKMDKHLFDVIRLRRAKKQELANYLKAAKGQAQPNMVELTRLKNDVNNLDQQAKTLASQYNIKGMTLDSTLDKLESSLLGKVRSNQGAMDAAGKMKADRAAYDRAKAKLQNGNERLEYLKTQKGHKARQAEREYANIQAQREANLQKAEKAYAKTQKSYNGAANRAALAGKSSHIKKYTAPDVKREVRDMDFTHSRRAKNADGEFTGGLERVTDKVKRTVYSGKDYDNLAYQARKQKVIDKELRNGKLTGKAKYNPSMASPGNTGVTNVVYKTKKDGTVTSKNVNPAARTPNPTRVNPGDSDFANKSRFGFVNRDFVNKALPYAGAGALATGAGVGAYQAGKNKGQNQGYAYGVNDGMQMGALASEVSIIFEKTASFADLKREYNRKKFDAIQRDIDSFAPYVDTGIISKDGKVALSPDDVKSSIEGLRKLQSKYTLTEKVSYVMDGGMEKEALAPFLASGAAWAAKALPKAGKAVSNFATKLGSKIGNVGSKLSQKTTGATKAGTFAVKNKVPLSTAETTGLNNATRGRHVVKTTPAGAPAGSGLDVMQNAQVGRGGRPGQLKGNVKKGGTGNAGLDVMQNVQVGTTPVSNNTENKVGFFDWAKQNPKKSMALAGAGAFGLGAAGGAKQNPNSMQQTLASEVSEMFEKTAKKVPFPKAKSLRNTAEAIKKANL